MQYFYGLLWLLTVHFIADFVLQSHWMALNKSKDNIALSAHVGVYTLCLYFAGIPLIIYFDTPAGFAYIFWVVVNGAAHFATDYVTSRINARLWAAKETHYFFVSVGADQLIHFLTLGFTMAWLL